MIHVRVIKAADPAAVGKAAADVFEAVIAAKPAAVIGLATGSTPVEMYQNLVKT